MYAAITSYLQKMFIAANNHLCFTIKSTCQEFVIFRINADRFG